MTGLPGPDPVAALDRLATRLELAAMAADPDELAGLARDIDAAAQGLVPAELTGDQRRIVDRISGQIARSLAMVEDRHSRERAAQTRDRRLRMAYGAGG